MFDLSSSISNAVDLNPRIRNLKLVALNLVPLGVGPEYHG